MKGRFPIFRKFPKLVYLDNAATAQKPKEVIDAITQFYAEENSTVHRSIYRSSLFATEKYNRAREAARAFLGAARFEEIIFTRGTTDAINLVAQSYGEFLSEGDEILLSEMEHHSNIVPWQMLAKRKKLKLCYIPMNQDGILEWRGKITENTKVVAVSHISNVTGTINPIEEITKEAHQKGAIIIIDGAQAAPYLEIDVVRLGVDFYAFSGHKCYGPTGIGVLYGKYDLLEKMMPVQGGGDMIEEVSFEEAAYQKPPLRFEAGTPIIGPAIALKSALDFLHEYGRNKIRLHGERLVELATKELEAISGLKILGKARDKAGLITFDVEGVHPLDLASFLDLKEVAIRSGHLCAQPVLKKFGLNTAARVSFGIYNTEEDVERFMEALQEGLSKLR